MILEKLLKLELEAKFNIENEYQRIETINGFRELLSQIDFSSEIMPIEDRERLTNIMTDLKGKQLTRSEDKLVDEIIRIN